MADLIMEVGLPGCGKSYVAELIIREEPNKYKWVSSDNIREKLWGDANDQRNPKAVFEEMLRRTIKYLEEGYNVVYDATNLQMKFRIETLHKVREFVNLDEAICLIFDVPIDECIKRAAARERKVSKDVIEKMARRYEKPTYDEGWDTIITAMARKRGNN